MKNFPMHHEGRRHNRATAKSQVGVHGVICSGRTATAIAALCLLYGMAWAEQAPSALPTVVVRDVTLTRPDIVRPRDGQVAARDDVAALLEDVPGMQTLAGGRVSGMPMLRGLGDERLRLSVDGMDLYAACPNHMNTPLSYLAPSQVERLEVWAGIAPVSAGGDAIGGVVAAQTRAPRFAPAGQVIADGEVGVLVRDNDQGRRAHWRADYGNDTLALRYEGSVARADNYHAGGDFKDYLFTGRAGHQLSRDEVGSTAYLTRNHQLSLAAQDGAHLWEARLYYQDMPYQGYPNQRMDLLDNRSGKLQLRYEGRQEWGTLKAQVWRENVEHFMDFGKDKRYWYGMASGGGAALDGAPCAPLGPTCAAGMPMYTDSRSTGAKVQAEVAVSPRDTLRLGVDWHRMQLDDWWPPSGGGMWPGTFWNIRDGERARTGLFGEWEAQLTPKWQTLAGLRYERVSTDAAEVTGYNPSGGGNQGRDADAFNARSRARRFNNVDWTVLAKYKPSAAYGVTFGVAHKERAPGLYELYPWSTWQMAALMNNLVGDGNGYVGNPDLRKERANTVSATFDWRAEDGTWSLAVTPYYSRVSDYINAVQWNAATNAPQNPPLRNRFAVLRYVNQDARLHGLDIAGQRQLAKTTLGDWRLRGSLSYTRGRIVDGDDGLYGIVPLTAKLALIHQYAGWTSTLEWVGVQAKTRVSAVRNEVRTPGYALVNVRTSYRWQGWRFDVGIDNLFDRIYYLPAGGSYVGQGTTMTNPALPNYPQWGTAVPGPGRTIYVGVTRQF